jgi:Ca-activated chloride channel family protein
MTGPARGAGLLIADGGFGGVLEVVEHDVDVTVNNGVAVTRVTQVFRNTEDRQVEALYTFPVPRGASVANFSMWINGKEMVGEVVEKDRAREIYNSYKQRRRDPGLLEQKDYKTFEMRIFPIAARAEQRVQVEYYQELNMDHDWATYTYPLATVTRSDIDPGVTGTMRLRFGVKSAVPLVALESPSHGDDVVVAAHDPAYYEASLETPEGTLERDIVIAYHVARPQTGMDLLTSRADREDGYFSLIVTAGEDLEALDEGMDYVFVLDVSGSMGNAGKLPLSRDSIGAFINALGPKDRFEVLTFNVQPYPLFNGLREVDTTAAAEADAYLGTQQARGGTVLNPAMQTAYRYADADRILNVVILSDGMTEQGERRALTELIRARPDNARVFCIGVGNEVNRPLLEQMAGDTGGLAAFMSRGDDFARQAAAFRRKLTRPVASELELAFDGVGVYDLEPAVLPNLYHGAPIRVYGRYRGDGDAVVRIRGNVRGRDFDQEARLTFPARDDTNPEIERMWAWHKVDRLLKQADRGGSRAPVLDEIVRLGEAYSIVTEYTSFLVLENDAEYKRWKIDRRNALRLARDRRSQAARRDDLAALRDKAVADIGPQREPPPHLQVARAPRPAVSAPQQPVHPAVRSRPISGTPATVPSGPGQSRNLDFGFGTGPVGPLFLVLVALVGKARKRNQA